MLGSQLEVFGLEGTTIVGQHQLTNGLLREPCNRTPEDDTRENKILQPWPRRIATTACLVEWELLWDLVVAAQIEKQVRLGIEHVLGVMQSILGLRLVEHQVELTASDYPLSLADMASLLDWDLKLHVYPTVRWLVHHRRAKLVDQVHPGLKTVFSIPQKLPGP